MSDGTLLQEVLYTNRAYFAAETIDTFAFGAYVVIASMSLYFMHHYKGASTGSRVTLAYTWSMLLITIAWYYCTTRVTEVQLIEDPTFSADPSAILAYCSATNVAGTLLSTMQFFGSDALLLFRAFMLFEMHWWMIIPGAVYISYLGVGIAVNLACLSPEFGGNLPLLPIETLANSFYVLTASMTIMLTSIICFKLLRHKRQMSRQSGAFRDNSAVYLSIVGILVESAMFYSACCWIWVGLIITNNPAIDWFDGILTAASFLNQAWIILRISMDHAYKAEMLAKTPDNWSVYARSPNTPISGPSTNETHRWQSGITFAGTMPIRDSVYAGKKMDIIGVEHRV